MDEKTLVFHLEALRRMLLRCIAVTALLLPAGFFAAPYVIKGLTLWCAPPGGELYYFSPMEVFFVHLKLALVLSLAAAFPWNILQLWGFILPGLLRNERKFGRWIIFSTLLFFAGCAFCIGVILPLMMKFSASFATAELQPMLGLSGFLDFSGWLTIAFGLMFQAPVAVVLTVIFEVTSAKRIASCRPYVVVTILILAAILTPPDVLSQILLALPTWLLFETGLFIARRIEKKRLKAAAQKP